MQPQKHTADHKTLFGSTGPTSCLSIDSVSDSVQKADGCGSGRSKSTTNLILWLLFCKGSLEMDLGRCVCPTNNASNDVAIWFGLVWMFVTFTHTNHLNYLDQSITKSY